MEATSDCNRREELVAYLYDDCESGERERFEAHLADCGACAAEVEALGSVRRSLAAWAPPDTALGFRIVSDPPPPPHWWRRFRLRPAWALAAAGAACVAAAVALGGVEARWLGDGFVVRVGRPAPDASLAAASAAPASAAPAAGDDLLMQRIRTLIEQSEQRQQQEFATRLLSLAQEFDLQRRQDRVQVQQEVGDLAEYLVRVSGGPPGR